MKWLKSNKSNEDDHLKPGAVFEKYTVVKQLGQGGMGSVYLVRHNVLDSLFALKILASDVASKNKQFVDRFIREAKLACKIRHPNLIAVHDAGQNPKNGQYYIVMDYVPGGSVRDLLKKTHRIPPDQALRIITQVADALTAACAHHMVHRDIKPDNIMFAADGSAKLADLGIAKSTDEQDTMITMASSVFGTPAYMSPEQAKDSSKVDSRADIYSLGIVFYEMLSGHRPFSGTTAIQILSQVMDASSIPDVRLICPDLPPELANLISRMVEKNVEKRIQSPALLVQELKKIQIPAQLAGRPLRIRDELAATSSAVPLTDATMPTAATAPPPAAPSPDVTMSTVTDASASVSAPPPATEVTMPTVADAPAPVSAPDVTMPTVATVEAVPAPDVKEQPVAEAPAPNIPTPAPDAQPVTEAPAPTIPTPAPEVQPVTEAPTPAPEVQPVEAPVSSPDVTMPTMAAAPIPASAPESQPVTETPAPTISASAPESQPVTEAPAPTISSSAPDVTMPTVAAVAEKAPSPATSPSVTIPMSEKAPSPAASSPAVETQKKSKRGIILVFSIAAACLVIVAVAVFAAILLFGGSSPEPQQNTLPVTGPADTPNSNTPSSTSSVADSRVTTSRTGTGSDAQKPSAGPAAGVRHDVEPPPVSVQPKDAKDTPAVTTQPSIMEMISDPLGKHQVVLLADTSDLSRKARIALAAEFGAENVSFQEAEGMGSYKQLLKDIVRSDPSVVVVCFAQQYADDGISASGFENVMAYHADQFRENAIPFLFIQPPKDEDDARIQAYIDVTTDLCRQRSISFVSEEDLAGGKFVSVVREEKKSK